MPEKYEESLKKAIKNLQIADHMAYITYPLLKDKRLILKILDEIYEVIIYTINSILQYDYLWKRIQLYKDAKSNFQTFSEKCTPRCGISHEQVLEILEILLLVEKHRKSSLEFARKDKVVIMTNSLKTSIIDIERIKKYLLASKKLVQSASNYMSYRG